VLFGIWLLVLATVLVLQRQLIASFTIYNPASLWVTMLIGLPVLWQPVLSGILQGKQNFKWLGWRSILDGVMRCLGVFVFVRAMGVHVTGAMAGVFLGSCTSLAISFWQAWPILRGPVEPVDWAAWLRKVIPLTLGLAAAAFMLAADTVFVRRFFLPEQTGVYGAVALIGRALMYLIVPVTQVMFPKVVQAAARSEATDAMTHALAATGLVGAAAALGCTLFPELPLRILLGAEYLPAKALVWVYAWCMIPATLTTVLINNLMARQHFHSVPWLSATALAYGVTLAIVANRCEGLPAMEGFRAIVLTFGVFSVLMLAITIVFTIRRR
jgi:O-antigen/teichoic acid export membrane protein